jgi:hypothetical protein
LKGNMKRTTPAGCAAFAAVLGIGALSFGQGQVTFINTGDTLISTNAWHLGPALGPTRPYPGSGGPQFVYALFAAPSSVTSVSGVMDPNWIFTGAYATNTAASTGGRLAGGQPVLPSPLGWGTTFNFLVRGWSVEIAGMDWPSAQDFMHNFEVDPNAVGSRGQLFGTSGIATISIDAPPGPLSVVFGTFPGSTIRGFLLDQVPIPEPSEFALLGLGSLVGAGFAVARRRRGARQGAPLFGDTSREP